MRKNKMMRLASGLLVAVLLTTCVISGTFAKYISEKSASDSARVAKWAFTVNGDDIATEAMEFDLFETINDTLAPNGEETDVKNAGVDAAQEIIAPGTQGSFEIALANLSEVTATYAIAFTVANDAGIPIEYSLTGAADSWKTDISQINVAATTIQMAGSVDGEDNPTDAATVTVYWRWKFEQTATPVVPGMVGEVEGDAADTTLGKAAYEGSAVPTITVTAKITATQVD